MKYYFTGNYSHNLDDRGRLAIPARLRDKLGDVVWVTNGRKCLVLYPDSTWTTLADQVLALPMWDPRAGEMRRFVFGDAAECEIDTQGRILIPSNLRETAGVGESVAIVGAGDYIEIWDRDTWNVEHKKLIDNPPMASYSDDRMRGR